MQEQFGNLWRCWLEKALECYKLNLMGHSTKHLEDQNADGNAFSKSQAQMVDIHDSTSSWPKGYVCSILGENLSTFCPCPEILWESQTSDSRLINLVEKISRHSNLQTVAWYFSVLSSQIYSKKSGAKYPFEKFSVSPERKYL